MFGPFGVAEARQLDWVTWLRIARRKSLLPVPRWLPEISARWFIPHPSRSCRRSREDGVNILCPARSMGRSNVPEGVTLGRAAPHVLWAVLPLAVLAWATAAFVAESSWFFGGLVGSPGLAVGFASPFLGNDREIRLCHPLPDPPGFPQLPMTDQRCRAGCCNGTRTLDLPHPSAGLEGLNISSLGPPRRPLRHLKEC